MNKTALSQSSFYTIIVSVKLNFRTLKAKVARSIEAHRTDAVEAISLRNQGIASNTIPFFLTSNFMAKASCFCLFFTLITSADFIWQNVIKKIYSSI